MGKIFYSLCGEGRGHASRTLAIVEELRKEHSVTIFTSGDAYELLYPHFKDKNVKVKRIPILRFHYDKYHKLNYLKTAWHGFIFLIKMPRLIRILSKAIKKENPDIVITDFEPALPRAAKKAGKPFLSFDHQHFLLTYNLSSLPAWLWAHATLMAQVVWGYFSGEKEMIVSSFYFPPLREDCRNNVTQVGVILRPEIIDAVPENKDHILVYFRRKNSNELIDALDNCGEKVILYGLDKKSETKNIVYKKIDVESFTKDLASCKALICTAGNQLVGEALYLGKPVLAIPEIGNYEQYINGHFLKLSGEGDYVEWRNINIDVLKNFINNIDVYRNRIIRERQYGNPLALSIIKKYL